MHKRDVVDFTEEENADLSVVTTTSNSPRVISDDACYHGFMATAPALTVFKHTLSASPPFFMTRFAMVITSDGRNTNLRIHVLKYNTIREATFILSAALAMAMLQSRILHRTARRR